MRPSFFELRQTALGAFLLALAAGCGTSFDPASEVKSLRVLGVQRSQSYPRPGESVELRMLWHDGRDVPAGTPGAYWFPPCFNPPGGLYYACLPQFIRPDIMSQVTQGNSRTITISDDILSSAPTPAPDQPLLGLTFEFFALCAGTLEFAIPQQDGALPIVCRDDQGEPVLSDSFVFGYVTLSTFPDPLANQNPIVTGFQIAGEGVPACVNQTPDEACMPTTTAPPADVTACDSDGDSDCPAIRIRPLIDPASAERDTASDLYFDRDVGEQMWIRYYADKGGLKSEVRLLNDAITGWNDDYGTDFYAPSETGSVNVWAVIYDNRGGMSWTSTVLNVVAAPSENE